MFSSPVPLRQRLASRDDVLACYQLFLGREPESLSSISRHLEDQPGVWTLVERFYNAAEAHRRRVEQACAYIGDHQDGRAIEVVAAPEAARQLTSHIAEVWSGYGREEAYFSVLTNPRYLKERLQIEDVEEFYQTGFEEVAGFERTLLRNEIAPSPDWRILELGCGVGRMAEAFAARYQTYIGVDISAEHLALAARRLDERRVANAVLTPLESFMSEPAGFDVFFSVIVLQHNPPPVMHQLLDHALAHLNPGGLACFQAPCHLYDYDFRVEDYLQGKGRSEQMEMHALPQRYIFALFAKHGLIPLEATPNARVGPLGFSYGFLARKGT